MESIIVCSRKKKFKNMHLMITSRKQIYMCCTLLVDLFYFNCFFCRWCFNFLIDIFWTISVYRRDGLVKYVRRNRFDKTEEWRASKRRNHYRHPYEKQSTNDYDRSFMTYHTVVFSWIHYGTFNIFSTFLGSKYKKIVTLKLRQLFQ